MARAGSALRAATATSTRSGFGGAASGAGEDEDETSALKGAQGGRGADDSRYTTDYYSMEPVGKRTLLRMLYSGVRPSEAARRIAAKGGNLNP